jgi:hypothetical protein
MASWPEGFGSVIRQGLNINASGTGTGRIDLRTGTGTAGQPCTLSPAARIALSRLMFVASDQGFGASGGDLHNGYSTNIGCDRSGTLIAGYRVWMIRDQGRGRGRQGDRG